VRIDLNGPRILSDAAVEVSFAVTGATAHVVGPSQARLKYERRIVVGYGSIQVSILESLIAAVVIGGRGSNLRLRKDTIEE